MSRSYFRAQLQKRSEHFNFAHETWNVCNHLPSIQHTLQLHTINIRKKFHLFRERIPHGLWTLIMREIPNNKTSQMATKYEQIEHPHSTVTQSDRQSIYLTKYSTTFFSFGITFSRRIRCRQQQYVQCESRIYSMDFNYFIFGAGKIDSILFWTSLLSVQLANSLSKKFKIAHVSIQIFCCLGNFYGNLSSSYRYSAAFGAHDKRRTRHNLIAADDPSCDSVVDPFNSPTLGWFTEEEEKIRRNEGGTKKSKQTKQKYRRTSAK